MKRVEHFRAHLGALAKVRTWEPIDQRRNWKGTLRAVEEDILTIEVDGRDHRIPLPAIERANLVYVPQPKGKKKGGSTRQKRGASR